VLLWLFRVRQQRRQLEAAALPGEPHERTIRREVLRAVESSLRCLWAVHLGLNDAGQGDPRAEEVPPARALSDTIPAALDRSSASLASFEMTSAMHYQARWWARQALYLLDDYRRQTGMAL
jgi:hypothetical protein